MHTPAYRLGNHRPENVYRIMDPDDYHKDVVIAHVCDKDNADLIVRALNEYAVRHGGGSTVDCG